MAIPSGSGTEVLKRTAGAIDGATTSVLTVGTNKICTILSIAILNTNTSAETDIYIKIHDGSADRTILAKTSNSSRLGTHATFVYNDRLVLTAGDILKIEVVQQVTYYISYIEQDWS